MSPCVGPVTFYACFIVDVHEVDWDAFGGAAVEGNENAHYVVAGWLGGGGKEFDRFDWKFMIGGHIW